MREESKIKKNVTVKKRVPSTERYMPMVQHGKKTVIDVHVW